MKDNLMNNNHMGINHDTKTFWTKAGYIRQKTKSAKSDLLELLQYKNYIGEVSAYGGTYSVKKVSDLFITPFYLPDNSYIDHKLLKLVYYIFNGKIVYATSIITKFLSLVVNDYLLKTGILMSGFKLDTDGLYKNQNLIKFCQKNPKACLFEPEVVEYLNSISDIDIEIKQIADSIIEFCQKNFKTVGDFDSYIDNLFKLAK